MYLHSVSTALPAHRFTQRECWERFREVIPPGSLRPGSWELLEQVLLRAGGIGTRHFVVEDPGRVAAGDAQALNEVFEREAPPLGHAALRAALDDAGWEAGEVDALIVTTCTGYLCPGLSSYLAELAGMRANVQLYDLAGQGCGAALPALRLASHLTAAQPNARVICVAVEVSSAAFFVTDDPGVLVSLCLFADGAAAVACTGIPGAQGVSLRCGHFTTLHQPSDREGLRFVNDGGKLRNRLDRTVPEIAGRAVAELFARETEPVDGLLVHPGGKKVLEAIRARIPGHPLTESAAVLNACGNMSSPSILFALKERLARTVSGRERLWLASFGAGFTCHACTVEVNDSVGCHTSE